MIFKDYGVLGVKGKCFGLDVMLVDICSSDIVVVYKFD